MPEHAPVQTGEFYLRYAGRIIWPRNFQDLTDTALCPACHEPLKSPACSACGLDLRHPAATELLIASAEAAAALQRRAELIGRIRYETEPRRVSISRPVLMGASAQAAAAVPTPPVPVPPVPVPPVPAPPRPTPSLPARPQRSNVQVVLLAVGVLLISVAAIFFLTVAWISAGLGYRSVIVALLTVAALVVAARMRRSRLTSTAEGIGSFAVVLVLLDVWGMRHNNLFGLGSAEGALYWGLALVACAALFLGWHAVSHLRVGSIAGFVIAVPGLGLLAAGLVPHQDTLTRIFIGLLGAAVGALLHRVTLPPTAAITGAWRSIDRYPERMTLFALASVALVAAALVAVFVDSDSRIAPIWCLGAVTLLATAHAVFVLGAPQVAASASVSAQPASLAAPVVPAQFMPEYRAFAYFAASLAAFAAAVIAPVIAVRFDSVPFALTVPLLVAVVLAVALESFGIRLVAPTAVAARRAALMAAGSAAIVAVCALPLVAWFAASPLAQAIGNGLRAREVVTKLANADNGWALLALVMVGAILVIGWAFSGLLHARRQIVTTLALAIVILAVPFAPSIGLVVALYLMLGAAALITLLLAHTTGRFSLRFLAPTVVALFLVGETLGYLISWAHPATWWFGTASLVLALWFARLLVARQPANSYRAHARGALLAAAIVVALIGVAHVPLSLAPEQRWTDSINLANVTAALALATAVLQVLVAAAALRPTVVALAERRWAFFTLLVPTIVAFSLPVQSWLSADDSLLQPEPFGAILRASLLVCASTLWLFLRANRGALHWERVIAAVALAPALLLLVGEVLFATDAVTSVFTLAPPAVALVVCSLALFRTMNSTAATGELGANRSDRVALEVGAAIVLVPAAFTAVVTVGSLGWLVVLVTGIVALIVAIAPDGLFGSRSRRRHFGWVALVLATLGLWLGLDRAGVVAPEPYVLPVAGVVLVTAALIRRFGTIDRESAPSPVAGLLTFAGLLIALLPLAVASESGSMARPLAVALVAVVLMVGAAVVRWAPPSSMYLAAGGLAGAIALVVTAFAQAQRLLGAPGAPDGRLELWLLVPAVASVATAALLTRQTDAETARLRRGTGIPLVLVWASVVTWVEITVVVSPADAGLSTARAVLLVVTLSAVHVLALWRRSAPLGELTGWSVLALAGLAAVTVIDSGVVDPFELMTVPVALALLGSGGLRLMNDPRSRSWPWCGPGLLLLLAPSLLLDFTYSELWRIVGLGVVAIIVLVVGSTRRLQAPFVIGAVVLIVHGVAQLWPWIAIAYSVIPWFLWLGAGGIVLIVLAARYEKRIANLKAIALRITALR